MTKRNNYVFIGLQIVSWIIFVGLCIEAGALIVNFVFSLFKPEFVGNLYQKLDLSQLYNTNKWVYSGMYGFILTISVLKAYLFYVVIMLLSKLDLLKPFSSSVAGQKYGALRIRSRQVESILGRWQCIFINGGCNLCYSLYFFKRS